MSEENINVKIVDNGKRNRCSNSFDQSINTQLIDFVKACIYRKPICLKQSSLICGLTHSGSTPNEPRSETFGDKLAQQDTVFKPTIVTEHFLESLHDLASTSQQP